MGVTIHFQGRLRGLEAYAELITHVTAFASSRDWPTAELSEKEVTLLRVVDGVGADYVGPAFGIELLPDPNSEPLRFEFDSDLYIQEYCKTQFAGAKAHVEIITLLRGVTPFFLDLQVEDEAEYWQLADAVILQSHLDRVASMMEDIFLDDPHAYGPVRLPSGRIIDVMQD